MAVGDHVSLVGAVGPTFSTLVGRRPLFGRVLSEGVGPPATATIVWSNGIRTANIDQQNLSKLHDPAAELQAFLWKWVQIISYGRPGVVAGGETEKSPAFSGVVRAVYGISAYDGVSADVGIVQVAVMDGKQFVFLRTAADGSEADQQLRIDRGRRFV